MKQIEIDIQSEIFAPMLKDINEKIQILFEQMAVGEFYGGDITAKISIELQQDTKRYDRVSPHGEALVEMHEYERPAIEYKVKLVLKKQSESKGKFCEINMELIRTEDGWILRELPDQQLKMIMNEPEEDHE